jgi:hypothetical protein
MFHGVHRRVSGRSYLLLILSLCALFQSTLSIPPHGSIPIFIDSDNSAGLDGERDIDDALAIVSTGKIATMQPPPRHHGHRRGRWYHDCHCVTTMNRPSRHAHFHGRG